MIGADRMKALRCGLAVLGDAYRDSRIVYCSGDKKNERTIQLASRAIHATEQLPWPDEQCVIVSEDWPFPSILTFIARHGNSNRVTMLHVAYPATMHGPKVTTSQVWDLEHIVFDQPLVTHEDAVTVPTLPGADVFDMMCHATSMLTVTEFEELMENAIPHQDWEEIAADRLKERPARTLEELERDRTLLIERSQDTIQQCRKDECALTTEEEAELATLRNDHKEWTYEDLAGSLSGFWDRVFFGAIPPYPISEAWTIAQSVSSANLCIYALANLATACGYRITARMQNGYGKPSLKKRTKGREWLMLVPFERIYNETIPEDGETVPRRPHEKRGHYRYLWKLAGLNRLALPAELYKRMTLAFQHNVRRVYVNPCWVGPRHWADTTNEYDVHQGAEVVN